MRDGAPSIDKSHPRCGLSKFLEREEKQEIVNFMAALWSFIQTFGPRLGG